MCKPVANLFDRVIAVDIACRVPAAIFFILQEINPFVGCLYAISRSFSSSFELHQYFARFAVGGLSDGSDNPS